VIKLDKDKKIKILIMSDSPLTCTGFATISRNIANKLPKDKFIVEYIGHNYLGQTLLPGTTFEDGTKLDFTLHGAGMQHYCADVIEPLLKKLKPDIYFCLLDSFMLMQAGYLNKDLSPGITIMYFPSDGGGNLPSGCENILKKFHVSVAMARYGQRQAKDVHGLNTLYIPHAVDTKIYFPLSKEEKEKLKAKYGLSGKFVVGVVARNQGRKMLDRTFKAFYRFAKDKDDVILYLHCDPNDAAQVFNMSQLINRYGLNNKVVFTGMTFFNGFDYKQMNEVYNVMDIFFLSSSGEGWGVPLIECQACKVPPVATDYTTTHQILEEDGKSGLKVKLAGVPEAPYSKQDVINQHELDLALDNGTITGSWTVERGIMDVQHAADQIQLLYDNPSLRKQLGEVGFAKVHRLYSWKVVMKSWIELFEKLVNKK